MRLALGVALLATLGATGVSADDAPLFPSKVELVIVDAVVVDKKGEPVSGLTRDDFIVKESGQPLAIESFEAFALGATSAPKATGVHAAVASNEGPAPEAGRAFALVVDDVSTSPLDGKDLRKTLGRVVTEFLHDGDLATLATASGDAGWSARLPEGRDDLMAMVDRLKWRGAPTFNTSFDYMSDYEAFQVDAYNDPTVVKRVVARWTASGYCAGGGGFGGGMAGACEAQVQGRARDINAQRRDRMRAALDAVRRASTSLAGIRGRKSILLFSPGFVDDREAGLREVVDESRAANTAVYFFDVRRLQATFTGSAADAGPAPDPQSVLAVMAESSSLATAGAQDLADDTGGFSVRSTNDIAGAARRVVDESRVFYLLGFYPPAGKKPEDWRKLKVEVKGKGLKVRARRGYNLRPPRPGPKERDGVSAAVLQALEAAREVRDIPLRAITYVLEPRPKATTHVVVAAELESSRLHFATIAKQRVARLEVSVLAAHRDSPLALRSDQKIEIRPTDTTAPAWTTVARDLDLPAGVWQIRVAVRELEGDAMGTVSQRVVVPPAAGLRLSTPVVTDTVDRSRSETHPLAVLGAHRVFASRSQLFCQFEVLGAAPDQQTGVANVVAGFQLMTSDGKAVATSPVTEIHGDSDGRLIRLVGFSVADLPDGTYDLVLLVKDETTGTVVEQHEPLSLVRDVSSS